MRGQHDRGFHRRLTELMDILADIEGPDQADLSLRCLHMTYGSFFTLTIIFIGVAPIAHVTQ